MHKYKNQTNIYPCIPDDFSPHSNKLTIAVSVDPIHGIMYAIHEYEGYIGHDRFALQV